MGVSEKKECRICGNENLVSIMNLGTHALSGIFPKFDEPDPIEAPLELLKCDDSRGDFCGLLQLRHRVSPESMYLNNYGYRSGINRTMSEHLKEVASEAEKMVLLDKGDVVLDIGSNDGTLLKFYKNEYLKRVGIDPTIEQFRKFYPLGYFLVSDFFTKENFEKLNLGKKAKIITSIAMFYDLDDPVKFARDIGACLDKEGIWVLEQSYMPAMLDSNSFDTICHEHLEYYSLKQIAWILDLAGLRAVRVSFDDTNGGSFRIIACHKSASIKSEAQVIKNILEDEIRRELHKAQPYLSFKNRVEVVRNKITDYLIKEKRHGKSIFVYGASTKGNTLLQYFRLGRDIITAAADRNPEKWGRRTPRTSIPIISEEEARKAKPDIFLALPWHFRKEFIEREQEYLNSDGTIVFPLPQFEIISKKLKINVISPHKKKALITGVTGQIGSHLAELLKEKGYDVYGLVRRTSSIEGGRERIDHLRNELNLIYGDLGDSGSIEKIILETKPDEIYNLAAQSHVGISFNMPEYTSDINAIGTLRICEATRKLSNHTKIYQASTSELYGGIYNYPVDEKTPFHPKSPYAIAKLYAYWIIKHYRETYGMFCSNGLVFNSESSRRGENFVTRKITKGIKEIIDGKIDKIQLGNLNAKRDWNHAKDTVRAIWLILQAEKPGDYVVASGETHSVREFVEEAFRQVNIDIGWKGEGINEIGYDKKTGKVYIVVNEKYFRPEEADVLIGNSDKIRKEMGWKPDYNFKDLVREMVESEFKSHKPLVNQIETIKKTI